MTTIRQQLETQAPPQTRCQDCGAEFTPPKPIKLGPITITRERCDTCEEKAIRAGRQLEDAEAIDVRRERAELAKQERLDRALAELAVPPLFETASLDAMEEYGSEEQRRFTLAALSWARAYCSIWPNVLDPIAVFTGKPGTGKTLVAWAIARHVVLNRGGTARVVKLSRLVRHIRGAWHARSDGEEERRIASYVATDLLVIDEVSSHAFYGEPTQTLYDVLDGRAEANKPTILTSNEDDAGLLRLLGEPLMDRCAVGGIREFGNESYRRWKASQGAS